MELIFNIRFWWWEEYSISWKTAHFTTSFITHIFIPLHRSKCSLLGQGARGPLALRISLKTEMIYARIDRLPSMEDYLSTNYHHGSDHLWSDRHESSLYTFSFLVTLIIKMIEFCPCPVLGPQWSVRDCTAHYHVEFLYHSIAFMVRLNSVVNPPEVGPLGGGFLSILPVACVSTEMFLGLGVRMSVDASFPSLQMANNVWRSVTFIFGMKFKHFAGIYWSFFLVMKISEI